jgi:putative flavoprotein involved in K+ transport
VTEQNAVVVVGAGHAGLSVSHELTQARVDHVVLERGRIGQTWRDRWDSFCLVTPNWTVKLPGGEYDGPDPDGFMPRDDIVRHLERYAHSFGAPVREGVAVTALGVSAESDFLLSTTQGEIRAGTVVLSTGAFQKPHRPPATASLPSRMQVIDAEDYRNPSMIAAGKVLVIGSGQTGCQIAEELHKDGRAVFLSCGRAPWIPRRIEGRDFVSWLVETQYFEAGPGDPPSDAVRLRANPQTTGRGGGRDLNFRTLQAMGVTLLGHLVNADERRARFASDLGESVAFGDARYAEVRALITAACATRGTRPPEFPEVPPFNADAPEEIDLSGFGAAIITSGFRPDYRSWTTFPSAFDDVGFPIQREGASAVVPGLLFCGVHYMRTRKSTLFMGVGEDASIVAEAVARRAKPRRPEVGRNVER